MNKGNEYIELNYNGEDYQIYVIKDDKKIKLNNQNKKIMINTLRNFDYQKINKTTIIFTDFEKIMNKFSFNQKKRKINREKSKKIISTVILMAIVNSAVKGIYSNISKSINDNTSTNIETKSNNQPEKNDNNKTENTTIVNEKDYSEEKLNTKESNITITVVNEENEFTYEYQEVGDKEALISASKYMDVFRKYEQIYGIDANLLCAIGAQESSGIHRQYSVNGYSTGIMGIENVWDGNSIKVFNFNTNGYEVIKVDYSKITDLDYNVKVGAAIFQNYFYNTLSNNSVEKTEQLAFALQKYNMGPGNMVKILNLGSDWISNREMISAGDQKYFEHVLSRFDNGTVINVRLDNGDFHRTKLTNKSLNNQYVR